MSHQLLFAFVVFIRKFLHKSLAGAQCFRKFVPLFVPLFGWKCPVLERRETWHRKAYRRAFEAVEPGVIIGMVALIAGIERGEIAPECVQVTTPELLAPGNGQHAEQVNPILISGKR